MSAIPAEIRKNGFLYKFIISSEKEAIYAQYFGDTLIGFEWVKIVNGRGDKTIS